MAAAELLAERELPEPGKSLDGLAKLWEDDEVIRRRVLEHDTLLQFPSKKQIGVITFETMSGNARVLAHVLTTWCPQHAAAKMVNIDQVRAEDWDVENLLSYRVPPK